LECGDLSPLSFATPADAFSRSSHPSGRLVRPAVSTVREENGTREKESGDESPHSKVCSAVAHNSLLPSLILRGMNTKLLRQFSTRPPFLQSSQDDLRLEIRIPWFSSFGHAPLL
jgi:hypothetical protein